MMESAVSSGLDNSGLRLVSGRSVPSASRYHRPRIQWFAVLLALACLVCQTTAFALTADVRGQDPAKTLVIDTRIPVFEDGKWEFWSQEDVELRRLMRRDPAAATATTTGATSSSSSSSSTGFVTTTVAIAVSSVTDTATTAASAANATSATSTSTTTTTTSASALPSPLDSALSSNFTSSCSTFINAFLADATFKQCYPFSMLLQGSKSFFNAEKSLVSTTQVLDATCSANVTFCTTYLTNLATNLTSNSNCATDFDLENSVVVEAYLAMIAYAPLYSASCLKDPETSIYCYADAVTNTTNPSEVYFYYLPLNTSLPGGTLPICGSCLQNTMTVFQAATANRKQPIALTYQSAASQVNTICGPSFVNASLAEAISTSAAFSPLTAGPSSILMAVPWLVVVLWLL